GCFKAILVPGFGKKFLCLLKIIFQTIHGLIVTEYRRRQRPNCRNTNTIINTLDDFLFIDCHRNGLADSFIIKWLFLYIETDIRQGYTWFLQYTCIWHAFHSRYIIWTDCISYMGCTRFKLGYT